MSGFSAITTNKQFENFHLEKGDSLAPKDQQEENTFMQMSPAVP